MRLLLDENLPKKLKKDFYEHRIFTIRDKGWTGKSNGALLELMIVEKFDALITFDQNLQHQQNFKNYTLTVIVLVATDNSYLTLKNLVPKIKNTIADGLKSGPITIQL